MSQNDDPTEVFKQAVTATMRAISGDDELQVTFGRGKPYLQGNRARVPLPESGVDEEGRLILSGSADMVQACRHRLSCVNRVEQQAFALGAQINGLKCLIIEFAVARLECLVGDLDIFRLYGIF